MKILKKEIKGITLVALVITIIVLLILSGVAINLTLGKNGIITKAKLAIEKHEQETAKEIIKTKIMDCQMQCYEEKEELPTLAYLAAYLENDKKEIKDIEYVKTESKEVAVLDESPYADWNKIYTKLEKYPYEFEIDGAFRIAINGTIIENIPTGYMKTPTETMEITENGNDINVLNYAKVNVNVPTSSVSGTLTLDNTQKASNIDVSEYQYVNTMALFTQEEYDEALSIARGFDKFECTFPTTGDTMTFDLGYVPTFIFISSITKQGYKHNWYSTDSCMTFYTDNLTSETCLVAPKTSWRMSGNNLLFTSSGPTNWAGQKFSILAIR